MDEFTFFPFFFPSPPDNIRIDSIDESLGWLMECVKASTSFIYLGLLYAPFNHFFQSTKQASPGWRKHNKGSNWLIEKGEWGGHEVIVAGKWGRFAVSGTMRLTEQQLKLAELFFVGPGRRLKHVIIADWSKREASQR